MRVNSAPVCCPKIRWPSAIVGLWRRARRSVDYAGGGLGLNLNLNRVSDNDYWRDFPRRSVPGAVTTQLTQRLLPSDASLSWSGSGQRGNDLEMRALRWQTLQDVNAPIVPPYDRLPQLRWRYVPWQAPAGLEASAELDTTRFRADRLLTLQPNAQRSFAQVQLSRPFTAPWGYVTPKGAIARHALCV